MPAENFNPPPKPEAKRRPSPHEELEKFLQGSESGSAKQRALRDYVDLQVAQWNLRNISDSDPSFYWGDEIVVA